MTNSSETFKNNDLNNFYNEFDLTNLLNTVKRRSKLSIIIASSTLFLSFCYAFLSKPIYRGEFQIVLNQKDKNSVAATALFNVVRDPRIRNLLGNAFDIHEATYATSISFFVSDNSVAGASVKVGVYEVDPAVSVQTTPPLLLVSSSPYELKAQDINSWVTVKLTSPLSLTPGSWLATVQGFQSVFDSTFISSNNNSNSASYLQDNCPPTPPSTTPAGTWFSITGTPMIRLNVSKNPPLPPPNSIEEGLRNFNIFPNPTNGTFTIELDKISNYDVFVKNMLGQTIYTSKINNLRSNFDFANYKKGVYTIELKDNDITYVEKIILE